MATFAGSCRARTSNVGGASQAAISLNTADVAPDSAGADGTFDLNAGDSITIHWRYDGAGTGGGTDAITLEVLYEDTATVVRTLYSGSSAPADGTEYTFYATDNGLVGGNDAIGTYRLHARWVKTGTTGGLGNFTLDTDGGSSPVSLGSIDYEDDGYLRGNDDWVVTHGGYPAGSTYAYGTASDEVVTITVTTAKLPATALGHEDFTYAVDGGVDSQTLTKDTTTTNVETYIVNDVVFTTATTYNASATPIVGNSPLSGIAWTVANSTTPVAFVVDPFITLGTPTLGETLYNRGEATTIDVGITNARAEALTRSLNYELKDSLGATKASGSDSGSNYDIDYTLGSSDDAATDFVGKQWTVRLKGADQTAWVSDNVYLVSDKLMMGSAAGLNDLAVTTDYAVYNRGESPQISYFLSFARGDAYASKTVTATVGSEDSQSVATTAGGEVAYSYLIAAGDVATSDETGSQKPVASTHSGNSHEASGDVFGVSDLYFVDLHQQLSGTLAKDDWPTEDANEDFAFVILGDVCYTWVHVEGVRKDDTEIDTSGSAITLEVDDPDGLLKDTYTTDTGADGWTDRININPTAPAGDWGHSATVTFAGNSGTASETITYVTPLTSNLSTLVEGPVLCKPAQVIRCYYQTEIDDIPDVPQTLPVWSLKALHNDTVIVAETDMYNIVDDTQTINGVRYYFDLTAPTDPGRYVIYTRAQLNGNGIRVGTNFRVAADALDPTGLFAGPA